jgi:FixJ family two-component response regulator
VERILVVDGSLEMARTLADGLADAGFFAESRGSGREALDELGTPPGFDALVTEIRLTEVDGLALLAESLRAAPERPVIMMTSPSALEAAVEAVRRGAYHYLTKPFRTEELVLFLRRALDQRALQRQAEALRAMLREHTLADLHHRLRELGFEPAEDEAAPGRRLYLAGPIASDAVSVELGADSLLLVGYIVFDRPLPADDARRLHRQAPPLRRLLDEGLVGGRARVLWRPFDPDPVKELRILARSLAGDAPSVRAAEEAALEVAAWRAS